MKTYKYLKVPGIIITPDPEHRSISEKKLSEYGEQGWKLVTFTFVYDKIAFAYFVKEVDLDSVHLIDKITKISAVKMQCAELYYITAIKEFYGMEGVDKVTSRVCKLSEEDKEHREELLNQFK